MLEQFRKLRATHIADALKELKQGGCVLPGWVGTASAAFVGEALPVQCLWEPFRRVVTADYRTAEIQAAVSPGAVPVFAACGDLRAVFGPVAAAGYRAAGAAGVVVDGGARGTDELETVGLPVLMRQAAVLSGVGAVRRELVERVLLQGCEVRAGDVVIAVPHTLIVVPAEAAESVAMRAQEIAADDERAMERLAHGESFESVWQQSARSQASACPPFKGGTSA
jgi:regulator of RNase E activity RraA